MKPVPLILSGVLLVLLLTITTLTTLVLLKLAPHSEGDNHCVVCGLYQKDAWMWPGFTRIHNFETDVSERVRRLGLIPNHAHVFSLGTCQTYGWFGELRQSIHGQGYFRKEFMDLSDEDFSTTINALHDVTVRHRGEPFNQYAREIYALFRSMPVAPKSSP